MRFYQPKVQVIVTQGFPICHSTYTRFVEHLSTEGKLRAGSAVEFEYVGNLVGYEQLT